MFSLVDEPTTTLTIQADRQTITARASGQLALDLRSLPHGATIRATLHDAPHDLQIIAFLLIPLIELSHKPTSATDCLHSPGSPKGAPSQQCAFFPCPSPS
jgi:hypothetical protein